MDEKIETAQATGQPNDGHHIIEDEPEYLSGWALAFLAGALMAGSFLLALDHAVICNFFPLFPLKKRRMLANLEVRSDGDTSDDQRLQQS